MDPDTITIVLPSATACAVVRALEARARQLGHRHEESLTCVELAKKISQAVVDLEMGGVAALPVVGEGDVKVAKVVGVAPAGRSGV